MAVEATRIEFDVTLLTTESFDVTRTTEAEADVTRMTDYEFDTTHHHEDYEAQEIGSGSRAFVLGGRRRGRRNS